MLQLENATPFEASLALFPNESGVDSLYVAVKATFSTAGRQLAVSEEQQPLRAADEYWGEPGESSVRLPGDVHLCKPGTDILLVGTARHPDGRALEELLTRVYVGDVGREVLVVGDREWTGSYVGRAITSPEPFEEMPLTWELAYGGVHVHDEEKGKVYSEPRNPVGQGFKGKRRRSALAGTRLPNLEDPRAPLRKPGDRPTPAGYAAVSPQWEPRVSFAGTYDAAWQTSRCPYLPRDYDPRFFQLAPEGLISARRFTGGEPVALDGVSREGPLRFALPRCAFEAAVRKGRDESGLDLALERILFEPDEERFEMLWRTSYPCDKQALEIERVDVALASLEFDQAQALRG